MLNTQSQEYYSIKFYIRIYVCIKIYKIKLLSKCIIYIIQLASLTSTHVSDQDTNKVDNNSDVNESQSIGINSINLNNHTSNDCESPSDSDNIATRVKAKYSKARQKRVHKKSQESNTRRRNPSESLSIEY
jgi:hypothetical protein